MIPLLRIHKERKGLQRFGRPQRIANNLSLCIFAGPMRTLRLMSGSRLRTKVRSAEDKHHAD